jgi:uncharacterized membrane protein YphA (DoxX/SURF4 family)
MAHRPLQLLADQPSCPVNLCPMSAKYASADASLRLAMALLFLVSATTKVTQTTAIQAYMPAYGVPEMLVWPAASSNTPVASAYSSAIGPAWWRSCWRGSAC